MSRQVCTISRDFLRSVLHIASFIRELESELQAVEVPGPVQLVNGAVSMLSKSPTTAFALSDLLSATCRQKNGENAEAVLRRLVELLRGAPEGSAPTLAGRTDAAIQAPSHLLAVLTAENPTLATTAFEQGTPRAALLAHIEVSLLVTTHWNLRRPCTCVDIDYASKQLPSKIQSHLTELNCLLVKCAYYPLDIRYSGNIDPFMQALHQLLLPW